jgi:hypothetical protein
MDLIRVGFAYAITHHLDLHRDDTFVTRVGSSYDTGGLDQDGLMAETVEIYYAEPEVAFEPYRAVETLMNKGSAARRVPGSRGLSAAWATWWAPGLTRNRRCGTCPSGLRLADPHPGSHRCGP